MTIKAVQGVQFYMVEDSNERHLSSKRPRLSVRLAGKPFGLFGIMAERGGVLTEHPMTL